MLYEELEATRVQLLEQRAELRAAARHGEQGAQQRLAQVEQALRSNGEAQHAHRQKVRRLRELALGGTGEGEGVLSEQPASRQLLDRPQRVREALRAVDDLHHNADISDEAALRLDGVIRADKVGSEAGYIAAAAAPAYRRAWRRLVWGGEAAQVGMPEDERAAIRAVQEAEGYRAMGIGSGPAGNFAVPVQLDPTVILASGGVANPLRRIARVETVAGNVWEGITSAGITAAFTAEATEASDANPVLAQPTAYVEKAQCFVPFSIEIGQDWPALEGQMAVLLADARDTLEAQKFISGVGHASNEPEGLLVGGTAVVTTSAATTVATGDMYRLKEALPQRFRPGAVFLGADVTYDKVRRLTGPGNTTEMPVWEDGEPPQILRRPAYEQSSMPSASTSGSSVLTYGDFSQYLIADRVGMSIELIPHLFGGGNRFPTGQRAFYAFWRTTSKVLVPNAFRTLKLT